MTSRRVPLAEQLEELEQEAARRHRVYPEMVARGQMRHHVAQMKQQRLNAAIRTLSWVDANRELIKDFTKYHERYLQLEKQVAENLAALNEDEPVKEAAE